MIATIVKKTFLAAQILILLFLVSCCGKDKDYPVEINMSEDNVIVEDIAELDFKSPLITNEAFNILALEYLREKYGEEFQLFDKEKREDDGTGTKTEWEKEKSAQYQDFYSSVANPTHPFFVFMQSPYRNERDNTKPHDSYVYAKMSVRFEKEIRELTKGLWEEFTVTAGLTYIDLSPNPSFFNKIDREYSEDVPIDKYIRENDSLSTLIRVSVRGNYDRIIDREAEREKIQILYDEIMRKQHHGRCRVTYLFPDSYDNIGSNEGVQYDMAYYEEVLLDTAFYPRDKDGNVRLTNSITLENGEETFGFRMYEYPLNEFMSYVKTDELPGYREYLDSLEYGKKCLNEPYPENKEVFDNSDYELFEGPFTVTGVGDAHIIVDLKKLGLRHEDIVVLQRESFYTDNYVYTEIIVPADFRVLPGGKIMFNHHFEFAIAKRRPHE